jgi:hypothetical protein
MMSDQVVASTGNETTDAIGVVVEAARSSAALALLVDDCAVEAVARNIDSKIAHGMLLVVARHALGPIYLVNAGSSHEARPLLPSDLIMAQG